jgi:hypothetical protein
MKEKPDTQFLLEALEDATWRADHPAVKSSRYYTDPRELAILADLVEAKYIRGSVLYEQDGVTPRGVAFGGINLAGRIYRDLLKKERDEKRLVARLKRQTWVVGGWIAGIATAIVTSGAKALLDFWLRSHSH